VKPRTLLDLLAIASSALDNAAAAFVTGIGAPSEIIKSDNDFATAVDIALERSIALELAVKSGIPVHGEEFGGPDLTSGLAWVLDPIDGTFNYSAGLPVCAILLALVEDGIPIMGLTWLPLLGRRFAATVAGPLLDGGKPLPALTRGRLATSMIAYGTLDDARGPIPGQVRFDLLAALTGKSARVRMLGSAGAEHAFTAAGTLDAAVTFSPHVWDNAAGVALVRAAGGVVTDLAGRPWTIESDSVLAAAPGVHDELLDLARSVGYGGCS